MGLKPHPYQVSAIKFASRHPGCYMMLDLGIGKSMIARHTMDNVGGPTLILAPKSVIFNVWPSEIKKWVPWCSYAILWGKDKIKHLRSKRDFYLLNYEGLKWFYETMQFAGFKMESYNLIIDEASWVKSPSTKRFKMLKILQQHCSPWRVALSASPATKGLHGLWSQYFLLDGGETLGKMHGKFISNLFDVGMPPMNIKTPKPNTPKRIYNAIAPITYRLAAKDYLKLPPLIINDLKIKLPSRLRATYDKMVRDFMIRLEVGNLNIANSATLSVKLRQFLQGGMYTDVNTRNYEVIHYEKMYMLSDILKGMEGKSVLIPIQFRFEVIELQKIIGEFHTLIGGQKTSYSSKVINDWNAGKINKIVCHPATVAYGLNLQGGGHHIIWVGLPWSTDHYHQLVGRLHRQGQTKPVIVNRIMFENTVDEVVAGVLADNTRDQQALFNAITKYMKGR